MLRTPGNSWWHFEVYLSNLFELQNKQTAWRVFIVDFLVTLEAIVVQMSAMCATDMMYFHCGEWWNMIVGEENCVSHVVTTSRSGEASHVVADTHCRRQKLICSHHCRVLSTSVTGFPFNLLHFSLITNKNCCI